MCMHECDEGSHWPGTWRCARLSNQGPLLCYLGPVVSRWQVPKHPTCIWLWKKRFWEKIYLKTSHSLSHHFTSSTMGLEPKMWTKDSHIRLLSHFVDAVTISTRSKSWNFKNSKATGKATVWLCGLNDPYLILQAYAFLVYTGKTVACY